MCQIPWTRKIVIETVLITSFIQFCAHDSAAHSTCSLHSFRHCIICTQSLRYLFALLLLFFSYFFLVSLVLFSSHLFISINTLKIAVFYELRSDHFVIFIVYYYYFVRFQFQCSHLILASHLKWKKTIFDVIQKYST